MKQYSISFGIPADRILTEERSRTTEENARFTLDLLHPAPSSRWLLVTSAYHMSRAIGAFRKAGFNVCFFGRNPDALLYCRVRGVAATCFAGPSAGLSPS